LYEKGKKLMLSVRIEGRRKELRKIIVSECLYGDRIVRYDGREKVETHPIFLRWKEEGRLIPVCPELLAGLPVPRDETQRRGEAVVSREGKDVTPFFKEGAERVLKIAEKHDIAFAVLKENSPSCGSSFIYDGTFSGKKIPGAGISTELLRSKGFMVFSENELDEAEIYLRELNESV
jgi:uncharacterized protein YbbK (DUF523 family)